MYFVKIKWINKNKSASSLALYHHYMFYYLSLAIKKSFQDAWY